MYMRLLELFSGTGSVGSAFAAAGWTIISLDSDPKTDATIHEDILTWDYTTFPPGHFDAVWASPCCTHYSIARRGAKTPRNLVWADSLVLRSQEIINYFNPRVWFIENPQTGLLKDRPFMLHIPFRDVDYCCYCDWGYRKRTRLWNNINFTGKFCVPDRVYAPTWRETNTKPRPSRVKTPRNPGFTDRPFRQTNYTGSLRVCAPKSKRIVEYNLFSYPLPPRGDQG